MKLINVVTGVLLPGFGHATVQQMQTVFGKAMLKANFTLPFEMSFARSSIIDQMSGLLQIAEYGCWCYFDGKYSTGRGKTVDEFDVECKNLHQNYACGSIDAIHDRDYNCIPWEVQYNTFELSYRESTNVEIECAKANAGDSCASRSCVSEMNFVRNVMGLYMQGIYPNFTFQHYMDFEKVSTDYCINPQLPDEKPHFRDRVELAPTTVYDDDSEYESDSGFTEFDWFNDYYDEEEPTAEPTVDIEAEFGMRFGLGNGGTMPTTVPMDVTMRVGLGGDDKADPLETVVAVAGASPAAGGSSSRGGGHPVTNRRKKKKKARGPDNRRFCCGQYPHRFPYNPQWGRRSCCIDKTYDTFYLHCCDDGFLRATCESKG